MSSVGAWIINRKSIDLEWTNRRESETEYGNVTPETFQTKAKKVTGSPETMFSARAWKMEAPHLTATLILLDTFHYPENAFRRNDNKERCLPPIRGSIDVLAIGSREPTPARSLSPKDSTENNPESKHRILLKFNPPPKNPSKRYAFGTDEQRRVGVQWRTTNQRCSLSHHI